MAYKQPRVPPMKEGAKIAEYIRELILFLKDFCLETWKAVTQMQRDAAGDRVTSVNKKTGAVTLDAADVGALPSDARAADSAKLGGKAPEYYLQPRDLLDNSDFANPVNQRGRTAYVGNGYTIDRWVLWGDLDTETLAIENGYIALNPETGSVVTLAQRFAKGYLDENKTYTLAYADTKGKIHTSNNPVMCFDEFDYVQIVANEWIGVLWAALYEGEYTADTLPPYVPKGYAAELMECQRYYQRFGVVGLTCRNNGRASVNLCVPMRINPSVIIGSRKVFTDSYEDKSGTIATAPVANKESIFFENQFYDGFITISCENVQLSADL